MAVEQIRPDRRPEQWCGPRRKILMSAQGLRFFSESPAALLVLLFQHHATSEMRGCLRDGTHFVCCLTTSSGNAGGGSLKCQVHIRALPAPSAAVSMRQAE